MTRFAWLQARTQTLGVAAALAVLAIVAAVTGVQLSHLYTTLVAHCQSGCDLAAQRFASHQGFLQHALDLLSLLAPPLLGIFWGAPLLARELESGTYKLAWTQSVTRSRWLLTKLAVIAAAVAVLSGLLTLTVTWWYRAVDKVTTSPYAVFDRRDIAPVAYSVFAFAVGALAGAVIRRTLPAMVTTLGVYAFALAAMSVWVRPHLLSPLHTTASLLSGDRFGFASSNGSPVTLDAQGSGPQNSWTLSSQLVDGSGHVASAAERSAFLLRHCPSIALPPPPPLGRAVSSKALGPDAQFQACRAAAARVFHLLVTYQPVSRYWTFQWIETGIFLALALLAAAGCYVWTTRRLS